MGNPHQAKLIKPCVVNIICRRNIHTLCSFVHQQHNPAGLQLQEEDLSHFFINFKLQTTKECFFHAIKQ